MDVHVKEEECIEDMNNDHEKPGTTFESKKGKTRKICPQCGAAVLDVNKHLKRVCNKIPENLGLKCPDCGRACSNRNQLTLHWSYVHEMVDNLFCNFCAKPCTNRMKLRQHTMVCLAKIKKIKDKNADGGQSENNPSLILQPEQPEVNKDLHYGSDLLCCNLCRKSCKSMAKLKSHTKRCLPNYLKQDIEKQSHKQPSDKKIENKGEEFQGREQHINCFDCGKPFSGIGTLIKHRLKCFSDRKFKDEDVNDLYDSPPNINKRAPSVEKNEPVCDILVKEEVPETFPDDELKTTLETSSWQDEFVFDDDSPRNENSYGDEKPPVKDSERHLACRICTKVLANKRYLKAHMHNKHSVESKVVCEYCAKDVKSTNIKTHIKEMHTNAIESKCPMCDKVFPRKKPLADHMKRVHSEEIRVVCQYCAKDVKSTNIRNHIKEMHTNVQETKCPICDKVFPRKKPMTDHLRLVHSKEKAVCETCSKTFENRTYLLRHIRTFHSTSDVFYTCDYCFKQFKSSLLLRNHIKIVHVVDNVECGICGKVYKNKILLGKHHRKYHRESNLDNTFEGQGLPGRPNIWNYT